MTSTHRARLRRKGQLTLPSEVAQALHVSEDDELEFTVAESGAVTVRGLTTIPADQKWFWTPEWQAGEREASAQIAAGEGRHFDSTEEFLAYLDKLSTETEDERDG